MSHLALKRNLHATAHPNFKIEMKMRVKEVNFTETYDARSLLT